MTCSGSLNWCVHSHPLGPTVPKPEDLLAVLREAWHGGSFPPFLLRWLAGLNLHVGATCANPPSARGQRVKAAAAVFEACLGRAARKAKWTPAPRPSARGTPMKGRQQRANEVGRGVGVMRPRVGQVLRPLRW